MELWSIWLSGFVLIGLSLYATQRLPSQRKVPNFNQKPVLDSRNLNIAIFTAPKPFVGSTGTRQTLAVRSWLALSPYVTVVLFSQDPSVASFADGFHSRVLVDTDIDFTFLGSPFFHSMIAKSRSFTSDISVILDPEIIIISGFISTLNHAYELDHDWLLVASSRNVSDFPFHFDESGNYWQRDNGKRMKTQELEDLLEPNWDWNLCDTRMILAWNSKDMPLHNGVLPPFLYGKGIHNSWVIHEALSSEFRFVLDATWSITSLHLNDDFDHLGKVSTALDIETRNWEHIGNSHIGALYGSFFYTEANYSSLPKLLKCGDQYIIIDTRENIVYPIGGSGAGNQWKEKIFLSWLRKRTMSCVGGLKSLNRISDCSLKDQTKLSATFELPFSLESLLSVTADKNKTIVLTVAGYSYKDMLMSWVCRLRHLSIKNFIVCAIDQETYEFSILQGVPVFRDPLAPSNISFNDCHFGTECFQRVTKIKSRIVLEILKLGYNVLLSDVDVYWFKDPVPLLHSFGPTVLAAQSDEFNKKGPINLPRRLNSGFYYAHSDGPTISAMEKVVRHAATSGLSEQPSFYDMLCGVGGSNRVDDNRCVEPETNVTVYFLDRDLFPNGAYLNLWQKKNVRRACLKMGCFIIHNNWISGRLKKLERQVLSGLWEYDPSTRMCLHSWHGLVEQRERTLKSKNRLSEAKISQDFSFQSKDIFVRVVYLGGKEELYKHAIPASYLMERNPGMFVARPEVFESPHESVLWPEELLLPGRKYIIIPSKAVEKLRSKYPEEGNTNEPKGVGQEILDANNTKSPGGHRVTENGRIKEPNGVGQETLDTNTKLSPGECKIREKAKVEEANGAGHETLNSKVNQFQGGASAEESFPSAKEFYVSKDNCAIKKRRGLRGKKPFVPPLPKTKPFRRLGWRPSLTTVEELSP